MATVVMARDPADARRLLLFLAITAGALVAATAARRTYAGVEADLLQLLGAVPTTVLGLVVLGVQVLHLLLFLGVPILLIAGGQWRTLAITAGGYLATLAIASLAGLAVESARITSPAEQGTTVSTSTDWLSAASVGAAITALVVISPQLNRPWRRFGWGFIGMLAGLRTLSSQETLAEMVLAIGIGGTVGYLLLLAFGRRIAVPTAVRLSAELEQFGIVGAEVSAIEHNPDGSLWFRARTAEGPLHCKVLTARGYQSDRLVRAFRRLRVRELGEDEPYSTVRRAAAVEAMLSMSATRAQVSTPTLRGIAPLSEDDMIIAFDQVDGSPLDRVDVQRITDDVLQQAWRVVAGLRSARIAHRDLRLANWLLDDDDRLWLIDFSFGEAAATSGALSADIAELLAATYPVVGAERAVGAAVAVLGPQDLGEGLSHLVPPALSKPTRTAVKAVPDQLAPLVRAASAACRVAEPEFAPIERFKPRTLVMAGLLAVAIYVMLPQLADLPRMLEVARSADPGLVAAAGAATLVMFLGVGLALKASIPARVGLGTALLTGIAANFVGAVAPPSVARVGVNIRFAQKQGLSSPVAVSAAAAKELATAVVHVVLLLFVAIVAGRSEAFTDAVDKLLSGSTLAIGVAVVVAVGSVVFAVPRIRALIRESVIPAAERSLDALRGLAADPVRMFTLFVGALLLQLGFIATLYFSVRALGGDVTLITIALIYLTVGSAATIAPTPGGLGAVEAVLLAALAGIGIDAPQALAAVFLYRLFTFWLPIPIGGLATRFLTARDVL